MTSLEAQSLEHPGNVLAQLLAEPETLGVPGAHHALCGMLARESGFRALYLSGAALSATLGLPDLGIITQEELFLLCAYHLLRTQKLRNIVWFPKILL